MIKIELTKQEAEQILKYCSYNIKMKIEKPIKDKEEYLKGIRKGKEILFRYLSRTQDEYLKEIINEFKEILGEKPLKKQEIKSKIGLI